jgi:WD40-like Beta Propeller Repeat
MIRKIALTLVFLFATSLTHAQLVPYYGKNNVKYDTFDWKTYKTQHFEIFFYPQSGQHLQRVASMAESAYDKISADLQHDIEFKIPLIFFKTQSEFEQVNYLQVTEGILGAAEPVYNRMAFAIDQPSDKLQELIMHELTHVFEFSMLFGGMISPVLKQSPPLWVMEGFAEYETGVWDPADMMIVRDAVMTERLPFLSVKEDLIAPGGVELGRAPYNVGHAAFEFMREKYGEAAVRQFWFYLKKATLLGTEDVIYSALGVKEETFNEQFANYLRDRFNEYRDKQSPIDYGREIGLPSKYQQIFSQAPSPSGKEFIVMTANREDYEFDILKIDATGKVLDNLTGGFTSSYDYLTTDSYTFEGRNLTWSANGQRIAFFARTGKRRSLIVIDAQRGDRLKKIKLKIDQAGSPALSPDGRTVLLTGLVNGQPDLFAIDVDSEAVKNLTDNSLFEKTPIWSQDGKWVFYTTRIRSRDQIMRMNPANPNQVEQLTFSEYDSTSPYYDQSTNSLYYASDRNGVYNLYKLDLNTGDKIQYTDVIGGNFSPVVIRDQGKQKIAFTSFFKGQYRFFLMDLPEPVTVIAKGAETDEGYTKTTAEQLAATLKVPQGEASKGSSSQDSDFHPTKQVEVDKGQVADKKFRVLISGRPSVITGVSGDTFAVASGIVLQDILGDQEFRFFTSRIRGFQSYNVGYLDLRHRFQYLTDFIFDDDFFFAPLPLSVAQQVGFSDDIVRSRMYGGRIISQYPFSRFYRAELSAGIFDLDQEFYDPTVQELYEQHLRLTGQQDALAQGGYMPLGVALVGETTRFREFGPLTGFTFRLALNYSPSIQDDWVSRAIYEADVRKYFRVHGRSVLAMRGRGFHTTGRNPVIFSFGGGQDVRGFDYREIIGTSGGIGNLEFRFPVWPNQRIPILGQLRAKAFVDYFRSGFNNDSFSEISSLPTNNFLVKEVDGRFFVMDLEEGAGSIGAGFTVFAGGLPFNFDFSKVYGQGRFVNDDGTLNLSAPTERKFLDGIHFDFSIAYDF